MSDSEELKPYYQRCDELAVEAAAEIELLLEIDEAEAREFGRIFLRKVIDHDAMPWPTRPSASKESCGELVIKELQILAEWLEGKGQQLAKMTVKDAISALQSSRGVEEYWIDELGYYVQYAFDHCDELMERFYPSIEYFEFDEFYMSKSLCRLQVTPVHTEASMSLVISTADYIEWVQALEDSNNG